LGTGGSNLTKSAPENAVLVPKNGRFGRKIDTFRRLSTDDCFVSTRTEIGSLVLASVNSQVSLLFGRVAGHAVAFLILGTTRM
jgi:hypothetical protein